MFSTCFEFWAASLHLILNWSQLPHEIIGLPEILKSGHDIYCEQHWYNFQSSANNLETFLPSQETCENGHVFSFVFPFWLLEPDLSSTM